MTTNTAALGPSNAKRQSSSTWGLRILGIVILALIIWRVVTVGMEEQYPLSFWISQLLNGLVLGGVYALVALGYTLIYGILFMINFAHGEVMMIGGVAGFFALQAATKFGWMEGPAAVVVMGLLFVMAIGMLGSILTGVT